MARLKKLERRLKKILGSNDLKPHFVVTLFVILLIGSCMVRKEPEKVWHIRKKMIKLTETLQGFPYKSGGQDLEGFDCSGLVYYVYDCFGFKIPRTAKKQARLKRKIKFKQAKPADILVFKLKRRYHTAIYLGDKAFMHAPKKGEVVRREPLNRFWRKKLRFTIRIIDE